MTELGIITGREIVPNRNGTIDRVMLQVQMTSADDIQTVELVTLPGYDANPINGSFVYIMTVGESYKIGLAVDAVTPDTDTGENRLYSTNDAGVIQAFLNLKKTGIIQINGSADFAVRFQALQTKLTALETQLLNHVHPGVTAGGASTGTSVTVFDIDITSSKVSEVRLP